MLGGATHKRNRLIDKFCRCIKAVQKTVRLRKRPGRGRRQQAAESAAFGICTKSVLQTRKKTLFKARCSRRKYKHQMLKVQPIIKIKK